MNEGMDGWNASVAPLQAVDGEYPYTLFMYRRSIAVRHVLNKLVDVCI